MDEYYKELELAIIWANVATDEEPTMDRFLRELNHEIADVVMMYYWWYASICHEGWMMTEVELHQSNKN